VAINNSHKIFGDVQPCVFQVVDRQTDRLITIQLALQHQQHHQLGLYSSNSGPLALAIVVQNV